MPSEELEDGDYVVGDKDEDEEAFAVLDEHWMVSLITLYVEFLLYCCQNHCFTSVIAKDEVEINL